MRSGLEQAPGSLLVVRLGAMGDVIHALPAAAALRTALPETRIGWVVEERWAELLCAGNAPKSGPRSPSRPLVDFVHTVDTKKWRKSLLSAATRREISRARAEIRAEHYEMAVDFQGALKSAVIARLSGARVVGTEHPRESPAKFFYHQRIAPQGAHVIEQNFSLAEAIAGTPLEHSGVQFPTDGPAAAQLAERFKDAGSPIILITPGAGWGAKLWPAERYGEVAKRLGANGFRSLINFAPQEADLAQAVEAASGGAAMKISCSISELIALMRHAKLFIGGDTGPMHLAAALGIPVVAIFGPTDPGRNGPYGTKSIVLRNAASTTSFSHVSAIDPGLMRITVEEVVRAARQLLEQSHA